MNTSDIQTQVLINIDDAWHNTLVLNDAVTFVLTQYDWGPSVPQSVRLGYEICWSHEG